MEHNPPTSADYANHNARQAQNEVAELNRRIASLERDLAETRLVIEKIRRGDIPARIVWTGEQ